MTLGEEVDIAHTAVVVAAVAAVAEVAHLDSRDQDKDLELLLDEKLADIHSDS